MSKKHFFTIAVLFFIVFDGQAQDQTPKYSNEFLSIGVGARALGLASSHVAVVNDVTAGYWNPAALLELEDDFEVAAMHAEYFAGIAKYDYAGFAMQIDSASALGLSVIRFGIDDIPDTRFLYDANGVINYDRIRFFSSADYAFLFSYARKVPILQGLSLGANVKVVHRKAGDFASAWGFGLDAAARLKVNSWVVAVVLRDITGTFNAWSHNPELVEDVYLQTGNDLPENTLEITLPKAIFGVSRYFQISSKIGVMPTLDLITTYDGKRNTLIRGDVVSIDPAFGMEFDYKKIAFLRMGTGNFQRIKDFDGSEYQDYQLNFGLGIRLDPVTIDYALSDIGNQSESVYSHVFSLKAHFSKK